MALSQKQLLEMLNYKNWIATIVLAEKIDENPDLISRKLGQLCKFGFVEKKDQKRTPSRRFLGSRSHLWRRLKQSSKTKQ